MKASGNIKKMEVFAQKICADGSVEDLGCIAKYERPGLLRRVAQFIMFWRK